MFKDFEKQSPQSWKEKIITDLKGGDYNELLVWNSDEGISIDPFYTKINRSSTTGVLFTQPDWNVVDKLIISEEKANNQQLLNALNWGATSIYIDITNVETIDFDVLFKNIVLDCIECIIDCQLHQHKFIEDLLQFLNQEYSLDKINLKVNFNCFSEFYYSGQLNSDLTEHLKSFWKIQQNYSSESIKLFSIDLRYLQNSGSKIIDQLAYTLSISQYYIEILGQDVLPYIGIFVSNSSNFFFEISKLRALRKLWDFYTKQYSISSKLWIYVENSTKNKTVFDPYVNMLRTGSETLSAVIGGADSVFTVPFDTVFKNQNEFSSRIARNQQILIKGESYLDKVADVSNGAYYLEHLTKTFEKEAFEKFKEIDKLGWSKFMTSHQLKTETLNSHQEDLKYFTDQAKPLLGTNLYPNLDETMFEDIEIDIDPFKSNYISCRRISIETELERLDQEKKN